MELQRWTRGYYGKDLIHNSTFILFYVFLNHLTLGWYPIFPRWFRLGSWHCVKMQEMFYFWKNTYLDSCIFIFF